jgi:hypothetical protein
MDEATANIDTGSDTLIQTTIRAKVRGVCTAERSELTRPRHAATAAHRITRKGCCCVQLSCVRCALLLPRVRRVFTRALLRRCRCVRACSSRAAP